MNKTNKTFKKFERKAAKMLDKKFGGLKDWQFLGDMRKGVLIIVITAEEK